LFLSLGASVINLLWFTGDLNWAEFPDLEIRIYVDGELVINSNLLLLHGMGFRSDEIELTPFGTLRIGKLAYRGGLYSTFPHIFSEKFKITATMLQSEKDHDFYFACRGLFYGARDGVNLRGSQMSIPPHAKLRGIFD
jgi:hypothetical protein